MLRRARARLSASSKSSLIGRDVNGLVLMAPFGSIADQFSEDQLSLVAKTLDKFQARQHGLVMRRRTEEFRKSFQPQYRDLEAVSGARRPFDASRVPADLVERKVELTGPVSDPAMAITALNSKKQGVSCFMGDAEDASTVSAANTVGTLSSNFHIARRTLTAQKKDPVTGQSKTYFLDKDSLATYIFRTPGLHLPLPSVNFEGEPASAFLTHAALYAVQNGESLRQHGTGTYFYVPKLEGVEEAVFVNDVFNFLESELGWAPGSIKATVLVETWPTLVDLPRVVEALQADNHIVGINCARWDYFASLHKHFGANAVFAPRRELTMMQPFMEELVQRIVSVGHHYGIHSLGGMSAFIPVKGDEKQNASAMESARKDKEAERRAGLDGAWIAHPGMAPTVRAVFDQIPGPNQIDAAPGRRVLDIESLVPTFSTNCKRSHVTAADVVHNIRVSVEYLAAWLSGKGAVALNNLMEDAATMEISRLNLWNHVRHGVRLEDGKTVVTRDYVKAAVKKELASLKAGQTQVLYAAQYFDAAAKILQDAVLTECPPQYLTLPAINVLGETAAVILPQSTSKIASSYFGAEKTQRFGYFDRRGVLLAAYRGEQLNKLIAKNDKPVVFLGAYTGPVAQQYARFGVHMYGGGWQGNAAQNRDRQPYPDTLFVTQGDCSDIAEMFNNYLEAAKINQEMTVHETSIAIRANTNLTDEQKTQAVQKLENERVDYESISVLIDGENGWSAEDKVINLVRNLVKKGVNIIHIEDQIEKRCGHIGGKSVHKTETMRRLYEAGRWVLHELETHEGRQLLGRVQLIARTDALDAKFFDGSANFPTFLASDLVAKFEKEEIDAETSRGLVDHFVSSRYLRVVDNTASPKYGAVGARWVRFTSKFATAAYEKQVNLALRKDLLAPVMRAIEHDSSFVPLDYKFVDWDKGHTPDGRFWYLREGCGLQFSIHRMVNVMDLTDFGWMETKDPLVHELKEFVAGVRGHTDFYGQTPFSDFKVLYNLSPSFNWQYNFAKEAAPLTKQILAAFNAEHPTFAVGDVEGPKAWVQKQLTEFGDADQGDREFDDGVLRKIFSTLESNAIPSADRQAALEGLRAKTKELHEKRMLSATEAESVLRAVDASLGAATKVNEAIRLLIAEERMRLFSRMIFRQGAVLQLITLPEFHFDQLMAAKLAHGFVGEDQGMLAYSNLVQRPEFELRDSIGYDGVTHQRKAMLDFWQSVLHLLNPDRADLAQKAGNAHTEGQMHKDWRKTD